MVLKLGDINQPEANLSCALTMLCAISGRSPDEMGLLMQQVCADDGRHVELRRPDYAPADWLEAIKRLGGVIAGTNEHGNKPYEQRPTIDQWIASTTDTGLIVIVTDDGKVGGEAHVFAIENGNIVDTYTGGKVIKFTGSPLVAQRVVKAFKIENAPAPIKQ
ncbi:MAG: hypothetical protein E6G97_09775 [Alphaproteobacteria bacterium]|nr:MAG: hypothetical protein E6G97_09775 [Alphaproteobacteria bacterium]